MKLKKNNTWTNAARLHSVNPSAYYLPESHDDIVRAVREAEINKWRIRAVGAGHSSTDIAICDQILLDMRCMKSITLADKSALKLWAKNHHLVNMEAGANIQFFNKQLDKLGLAFPTLGIIDDQTISGAIATGTHGNVRNLPGLPGLVRSLLLVAAAGQRYRIEPENGITDPGLHKEPATILIQNDDTFYSSLIHCGAFGIIASYIMEVEPRYWLLEKRTVEKWSDIRRLIEQNKLFDDYPVKIEKEFSPHPVYGLHIALNPHEVDGDHTCMVGRFFKLTEEPRKSLGDRIRGLIPTLAGSTRLPFYLLVHQAEKHPEKLPKTIDGALHLMNDESFIDKSYKVWFQGLEFLAKMTYGTEFAFDGENPDWLKAVDAVIDKIKILARSGLYPPNPIMIRYSQGSPAYLAPEHGLQTTAWIGTPVPRQLDRGMEVLTAFQEACMENAGKVHWGKMNNAVEKRLNLVDGWFPKMEVWKKEMRKFNPDNTFSNGYTDRFGLTT